MDPREDYADPDPVPWWASPAVVQFVVAALLFLSAVIVWYYVLPILLPGFPVS